MAIALMALARPYRPRPEWMDDANLLFALVAIAVLVVFGLGVFVQFFKGRRAEKHAALNRVRARQRRS